ncbi:MAG: alpha-maltose-phosphate synthase [Solirubrobacteraceae bacterium]|nr:alpha-maltose-phosphate synthase [Solirubrobacteraceae bacterium]
MLGLPYPHAVGGAERWVEEAARALSSKVDLSVHYMAAAGRLPLEHEPPCTLHRYAAPHLREADRLALSRSLVRDVARADVVHVHHYGALTPHLLALRARLRRDQAVFVTDLGSNGVAVGRRLGLHGLFHGFLELSAFATGGRPRRRTRVVWGGVDAERHRPAAKDPEPFALFVGRLMPHKGIDVVIEALPAGRRLVVAGRPHPEHPAYARLLRERAAGKDVRFVVDAGDRELARLYASATVTLLPSLWVDVYGHRHSVPELLGLTLLESLASGTPVIATDVASLPEIVRDGDTGRVVAPGDVRAMTEALERFLADPGGAAAAGLRGRADVLRRFTWDRVAERCLDAYRELG